MKIFFYVKVLSALFCLNTIGISQTIWKETDFTSPKGHTWINPANYEYGGDVYIQNVNPVSFSSDMNGKPNTGVLSVENGGKLTADGKVIVEQTGTTAGDAVLIFNGGKANFNGGLTAITRNVNNNFYTVASMGAGSQLYISGDSNILSEFEKGYGLYLGEGTINSFNKDSNGDGILNISTGVRGIHTIGNTNFNQPVNIQLNANGATGVLTINTSSLSTTNFNEKLYITNNSVSDNTSSAYGVAVNNANGIINLNNGAEINFGNTYTNGNEIGLYSGRGVLNVLGDLFIHTDYLALYAVSGGKIDINNSVVDLKGDIVSNNASQITMDIKEGSKWKGASQMVNSSITDITMRGSTWEMTDDSALNNLNLFNNSNIYLNSTPISDNFTPKTLTVTNDYNGDNSTIIFNTKLEGDPSLTDKLEIQGNTSGTTKVRVRNVGGSGAQTIEGIELITVNGSSDGEFLKDGRIVAGAYDYLLSRGDGITTDANDWYLISSLSPIITPVVKPPISPPITPPVDPPISPPITPPVSPPVTPPVEVPINPEKAKIYRPEFGSYLTNNAVVNTLFYHNLYDRLSDPQYTDTLSNGDNVTSIWVRNINRYNKFMDESKQLNTYGKSFTVQIGGDIAHWTTNNLNRYHLGIMGGYGFNHNNTNSKVTNYKSKGESEGYNLGIYGTWFTNFEDRSGFYIDNWLMYSWFDNTVKGDELEKEKYRSKGITASIEGGYSFRIDNNLEKRTLFIQPKIQAVYMGVDTKDYTESNGTVVKFSGTGNIQTRLGMRVYTSDFNPVEIEKKVFQPFAEATWIHNQKDFKAEMNGVSNKLSDTKNLGEIKLGTEIKLNQNFDVWGNVAYQWGKDKYADTAVLIGIKYRF